MKKKANSTELRPVQEYLEVPLRHPLLVVGPTILVLVLSVVLALVLPERYRSSTLILVEAEAVPETFVRKLASDSIGRRLQTVRQEVLSRTRLEQVITELDPYPSLNANPAPISSQVESMRSSITIRTKGSDAFTIQYVHTDPVMAMQVTDRLATLFIEEAETEREQQAIEGTEFIESQLDEMRMSLEEKETAVARFKERNLGRLPEQLDTNLATLQRLQMEQQTLEESIRSAEARSDLLRQSLATGTPVVLDAAERDPSLALTELRQQLATLRSRYTEHHPDVKAAVARVRELEAATVSVEEATEVPEFDGKMASTEEALRQNQIEIDLLRDRRAKAVDDMARLQARVEGAPRVEQQLSALTRDYSQLQESYLKLLQKQIDARMAEQLERRWKGARFQVLDPADVPDEPFFPPRMLMVFAGLVGGLGLGLLTAFGADFLDHSFKNPDQLENALGMPLLAVIPRLDDK
jgi:polysaccharide chain length determinant protein (PEP-CTERM system associated)